MVFKGMVFEGICRESTFWVILRGGGKFGRWNALTSCFSPTGLGSTSSWEAFFKPCPRRGH